MSGLVWLTESCLGQNTKGWSVYGFCDNHRQTSLLSRFSVEYYCSRCRKKLRRDQGKDKPSYLEISWNGVLLGTECSLYIGPIAWKKQARQEIDYIIKVREWTPSAGLLTITEWTTEKCLHERPQRNTPTQARQLNKQMVQSAGRRRLTLPPKLAKGSTLKQQWQQRRFKNDLKVNRASLTKI